MSSNISDVGFHNGLVRSDPDYFFKKESIAAATGPAVVVEKMLGDLQGGVEIVVTVNEALTVDTGTTLVLTINRALTAGDNKVAAITKTIAAGSYAAGTVLFRYIPGPADVGVLSLAFTSDAGNTGSIDAFQHPVAR